MSPPRDNTACQTSPCKCKICISSIESDVYNKKKIQMFVVNMTFILSSEVKKCIFHECRKYIFSKYAFYFINNSLYFITLYIINGNIILKEIRILSSFEQLQGNTISGSFVFGSARQLGHGFHTRP